MISSLAEEPPIDAGWGEARDPKVRKQWHPVGNKERSSLMRADTPSNERSQVMPVNIKKIRVVVVDDSALIRNVLTTIINEAPDMEVVATAADPILARERIRATDPDVVTLDVEMPRMDGIEFLRRLMRLKPTPVLMISTLTQSGSETALAALALGAVDFIPKPAIDVAHGMQAYAEEIREKIRMASLARARMPHRYGVTAARSLPKGASYV